MVIFNSPLPPGQIRRQNIKCLCRMPFLIPILVFTETVSPCCIFGELIQDYSFTYLRAGNNDTGPFELEQFHFLFMVVEIQMLKVNCLSLFP